MGSVLNDPKAITIGVLDTNPETRDELLDLLSKEGYQTVQVENAESLLESISNKTTNVDVLMLDMVSSPENHMSLVQNIDNQLTSDHLPVIMLSDKSQSQLANKGLQAGASHHMTRPLHKDALLARVEAAVRDRQRNNRVLNSMRSMRSFLEDAQRIQAMLLPQHELKSPVLRFEWRYIPRDFAAGDIFAHSCLEDCKTDIFYLADVSGHGVASAMMAFWLYHSLDPAQYSNARLDSPETICTLIDHKVSRMQTNQFATMAYIIYEAEFRRLTYCLAGHPYPILIAPDRAVQELTVGGLPLGMSMGIPYVQESISILPGSRLFFFSDGLIEAVAPDGRPLGQERLAQQLVDTSALPLDVQLDQVLKFIDDFCNDPEGIADDLTLIGVEFKAS